MEPLADLIDRQRIECLAQAQRVFEKLEHLEGLIEIIAGQMKRELRDRKADLSRYSSNSPNVQGDNNQPI